MRQIPLIAFLLTMGLAGSSAADDVPGPDDQGSPSDRSVARISLINGDVSVRRGDSGDVTAAVINAPLMAQDTLLTSSSSRAEVQLDSANVLRIGSNSEVRIGDLQYHRYQVQIALGTATFRVLRDSDAQTELDTPVIGVRPLRRGVYRITVREDGSVEVTVREGEADIVSQHGSERLRDGSTMLARGSVQDPEFQIVAQIGPDEWDHWNASRDRELLQSRSRQYVSPDIEGVEDLDAHGRWVNDETYGNVWAPAVDPGWAPYRSGRWVYEPYYGWTWLSSDPWGWAPYHYGRWFQGPVGWCWYPGALFGRHYWSPALVAFVGFGGYGGFHAGFGFGNVGWIPLGPHEPFNRWWGGGRTTIVNNFNVTNVYRNARVSNGMTTVNAANFGRGGGQYTAMSGHGLQNASLVRGGLGVTPDRSSMRFSDRQVNQSAYPQSRGGQFYGGSGSQRGFSGAAGAQAGRSGGSVQQNQGSNNRGWQGYGAARGGSAPSGTYQPSQSSGSRGWQGTGTSQGGSVGGGSSSSGRGWQGYGSSGSGAPAAPPSRSPSYGGTSGGWSRGGSQPQTYQPSAAGSRGTEQGGSVGSGSRSSSRGWQGYGSSGSGAPAAPPSRSPSYGGTSGGWSRGGSQPQTYQPSGAGSRGTEQGGSVGGGGRGWQGYGSSGSGAPAASPSRSPSYGGTSGGWNRGGSQPQNYQSSPSYSSRGSGGGSPVRISPPIVRSAPQGDSGGGGSRGSSSGGSRGNSGGTNYGGGNHGRR